MAASRDGQGRRQAIDAWRGFALVTIFLNHVPGNLFMEMTHYHFGFSDAAELFVLLAGVSAALAWERAGAGMAWRVVRSGLRIWQLYTLHLFMVLAGFGIVGGYVLMSGDNRVLSLFAFDVVVHNTTEALSGIAALTFQPPYFNILPLYIVLLALTPLFLPLLRRGMVGTLALSAGIYLAAQVWSLALPSWPAGSTGWWFNPIAWQFLFVAGLAIGLRLRAERPFRPRRLYDAAALLVVLGALAVKLEWLPGVEDGAPFPAFLWDVNKSDLHLPRLLHSLALVWLCGATLPRWLAAAGGLRRGRAVLVALGWRLAPVRTALATLGRHSLPVFCFGTLLAVGLQVTRFGLGLDWRFDVCAMPAGVLLQYALARLLGWYAEGQRPTAGRAPAIPRMAPS